MTRWTMAAASLAASVMITGAAHAQSAVPGSTTGTAQTPSATPAPGAGTAAPTAPNSPKQAIVKPGQTLKNGPDAATGVTGSGNAGAGGGVAPGQQ